jgi:sialate O-acetylesterase
MRKSGATLLSFILLLCLGATCGSDPLVAEREGPGRDADIWILAGQSNMVGCGKRTLEYETDPRIWLYNMDNSWIPAVPPLHRLFESVAPVHRNIFFESDRIAEEDFLKRGEQSRKNPQGGVGSGYFFARHLLQTIDRDIGLVACAHGGTTMKQWDPDLKDRGDASLYGATLNRIEKVGGNLKGILWYQGESEAMEPSAASTYEADFLRLIDRFREDTGRPDLPFLFVQIGRWAINNDPRGDHWEVIRDIQRRIPEQREHVYMTSAIDLPLDDQIHISTAGQERLGVRLAEMALTQVYAENNHAQCIALASVTIEKPETDRPLIRCRFSGVNGRLVSAGRPAGFEIRARDASGAVPQPYEIDFEASDPASLVLRLGRPLPLPAKLVYGPGLDPYANIVDRLDMPIPAFTYELLP